MKKIYKREREINLNKEVKPKKNELNGYKKSDMFYLWYGKTRVTSYELRVSRYDSKG